MKKTFVIGDIHGCLHEFEELLGALEFDAKRHRLWLVGDIVNRGPDSLGVLRKVAKLHRKMGDRLRLVLGNHDLHLLGAAVRRRRLRAKDTLDPVFDAADAEDLLAWLRRQPLAHAEDGYLLVHAGLHPNWRSKQALTAARRLEKALRRGRGRRFFETKARSRSLAALTRLRMLDSQGRFSAFSGSPEEAPRALTPWYKLWTRNRIKEERDRTVLFGHWAALGQRQGGKGTRRWISLDSGCVYGRSLTALQLPKEQIVQLDLDS